MHTIWEFYETPLGPRPIHPVRSGRIPAKGHRRPRLQTEGHGGARGYHLLAVPSWSRRIRVALDCAVGLVLARVDIADLTELSRSRKEIEDHA
jgi:hypothetical protein